MSASKYISETSKEYAIYTAENRAIPKLTDGLKNGQRIALWVLRNKADEIKTISVSGAMLGEKLYVHGDASANDTVSSLAAPYLNNICLIEGIGNFGTKLVPNEFSAPRYTSVKRSKFAEKVLYKDLDLVPLIDNYDGSVSYAGTFLPTIPIVLLNGISGIAVGWSTEILPHRLEDIVDACVAVLDGKSVKQLKPYYDAYNVDVEHIEGDSWYLNGKVEIAGDVAIIKEVPAGLKIEKLHEHLDSLEDDNVIKEYVDRSSDNINVQVKFKRGELKDKTVDELIDLFKIRKRVTERIVVGTPDNRIRAYDTHNELIKDFVEWRLGWFSKRYQRLLEIAAKDLAYNLAIKKCFDDKLPEKLSTIKSKSDLTDVIKKSVCEFNLDDSQIDKIVTLPTYRWTSENLEMVNKKIDDLVTEITGYEEILADDAKLKDIYKSELLELKQMKF